MWGRRRMETRCDKEAVTITQNANAAINALKKRQIFNEEMKSKNKGTNKITKEFWVFFYALFGDNHPKNVERIKNIEILFGELAK